MQVDGARILSNATLFEGSVVETGRTSATLRLENGGAQVRLASDSRGTLYRDRLVLARGSGEVIGANSFAVEAAGVRILTDGTASNSVVVMHGDHSVDVAALTGSLRVTTNSGFMLASLTPGRSMNFQDAAGASAPTNITGCVSKIDNAYFLTVSQTGVVYELTGQNLDDVVGKNVNVVGTPEPNGQPKRNAVGVILVTTATPVKGDSGCSATAGGAIGAVGAALGMKLLIGGIVVGAATGSAVGIYEANSARPTNTLLPAASF